MQNVSSSQSSSSLEIQETEKQLWSIIRTIPGWNVAYGSVRCIVHVIKKDNEESISTAIDVAEGAVQTAAITAGVLAAPVTVPVGVGGVLTGIAFKSVCEGVEVLIFFVTNAEQFQGKTSDEKEMIFYDKIKHVTGIGALYSAARVPVYVFKRRKQQSMESAVNLVTNLGDAGVQVGVGFIPGIDSHTQKVIERTARHAIKFFSKKALEQGNQQHDLDSSSTSTNGTTTNILSEVKNNCQAILEIASSLPTTVTSQLTSHHKKQNDSSKNEQGKKSCHNFLCCCFKRNKRIEENDTDMEIHNTKHVTSDSDVTVTNPSDHDHAQVIILTE